MNRDDQEYIVDLRDQASCIIHCAWCGYKAKKEGIE